MDKLKAMKAELAMLRKEKIRMEEWIIALESAMEKEKRMLSEYKAMAKLVDDLLDVVIEARGDNLDRNNGQNLDEEIMKGLIEEATRSITEALNETQSRGRSRPAHGRNIGRGREGSFGDQNLGIWNEALRSDGGKKDGAHPK